MYVLVVHIPFLSLHSPSYYGSKLWNSLPNTTSSLPTVAAFKLTICNAESILTAVPSVNSLSHCSNYGIEYIVIL